MERRRFLQLFAATTVAMMAHPVLVLPPDTSTANTALTRTNLPSTADEFTLWELAYRMSEMAVTLGGMYQVPLQRIFNDVDISQRGYYERLLVDYKQAFMSNEKLSMERKVVLRWTGAVS